MINLLTIVFTAIVVAWCYWFYHKTKPPHLQPCLEDGEELKSPPCLPRIPILGSLPFLPAFPIMYRYFTKHSDKYKDVVAYYLMDKYRIVLNSREAIQEAFIKRTPDFADRPSGIVNNILNPNRKGILFHPYDEEFQKYHKLSIGVMKQLGLGTRAMELRINEEISELFQTLERFKGNEFNPSVIMRKFSMNIICGLLFGRRFDDNDPQLDGIIANLRLSFTNLPKVMLINICSLLRFIPYVKNALSNSLKAQENIFAMLERKIIECTDEIYDHDSFIRSYIKTMGQNYDKDQLLHFMHEIFLAGTETTASALLWTLVLLANHPEVQAKMFTEMEKIGKKLPSMEDKKRLPYCEAVLCEIFRMKPAAPMTLPHYAMRDTHVMGYFIPDKTIVVANLHSVHHDLHLWNDPENFRPERFIEKNGLFKTSMRDLLVPFSLGKRSCFGEMLAKQELFLSVTNLVKMFDILPPVDQKEIIVDDVMDVTSKPSSFTVILAKRQQA